MLRFVADTHALLWHLTEPKRLGKAARRAFASAERGVALCRVPVISLVEISLLHERGRLRIGPAQILETLAGHPGYSVLALDLEQAVEFGSFPGIHDPMDRLIAAAARATGARLISADQVFDAAGIERIWD